MIFDRAERLVLYRSLSPNLARAIDYLDATDLSTLPVGRYGVYNLDVYAMVQTYTTKPADQARWETHRRFIDIQLMIEGSERMDVADITTMRGATGYDATKDATFYDGVDEFVPLVVRPATFAVFFPHDAHRPTVAVHTPTTIRKIVVKVAV